LSEGEENCMPMTPQQVADLASRGHAIGNHTLSHARLSTLGPEEARSEVLSAAELIRSWISVPVEAFAWTFSWDSISPYAWKLITAHHRFCFSPCPGVTRVQMSSQHLIWRTNVEAHYSPAEYRFMYSGLPHAIWVGKRRKLRTLLDDSQRNQAPVSRLDY
jgi:peptidoglycan/xylan/chitin deacetylase (PgdA/CDA1 family)